ncbi:MAG: hypothetical protein KF906_02520 [Actinobacteria bacterium]|nr:hypothetical protein [Actinomycetota bacterium]
MPRRSLVVLTVLLLMAGLVGCSSDAASAPDTTAASTTTSTVEPEEFDGTVDDFYVVPDPLPPGERGALIRVQPLDDAGDGQVGLRIMYHSEDVQGRDRAVTGVVLYPTGTAPDDGWPVVAYAHGTTGIASKCAPSRLPLEPPSYGVEGVRVATDYIGLGPVGEVHSYLSATAEGNAMIDAVRAARSIADAHAGTRWVVVGHSQGGHGALVTMDRAGELPDMELLGTVALAPGAEFTKTFGDEVQLRIITTMVLIGGRDEWPDSDPADYLSPEALAAGEEVTRDACLDTIISTMLPLAAGDDFYVHEPDDGPAREFMVANDPTPEASPSPLLLMTGTADIIVVPDRVRSLRDRLCSIGQVLEYGELEGVDHGGEPAAAAPTVEQWLADRFAGRPAPNSCLPSDDADR